MKDTSIEEMIKTLTSEERKIYDSILRSFPATSKESAYNHAINGGVKFQFSPS